MCNKTAHTGLDTASSATVSTPRVAVMKMKGIELTSVGLCAEVAKFAGTLGDSRRLFDLCDRDRAACSVVVTLEASG